MDLKEFSEKVVLITGASSGIGATTAIHFAKLGASLVLTGRNLENLKKTEQQCSDSPSTLLISADLINEKDIENIIQKTIHHFGKLDVLVNNAGIFEGTTLENTTVEQLDRVFNTNMRSVFQLTKLAIPHLKNSKGNIVNISSLAGLRCFPGVLSYSISKSALDQFTQCIALELAPYQVRVNGVNPGTIETDIFRRIGMSEYHIEQYFEKQKGNPLGRIGQPEDVGNVVTFLASDKASFITGVLLPVDGGWHTVCQLQ